MSLEKLLQRFYQAATSDATLPANIVGVISLLWCAVWLTTSLKGYASFVLDHEAFYEAAFKTKRRIMPFKLPLPQTFPKQYYLLEHQLIKKMFASSPALDHRASLDLLHLQAWEIPLVEHRETTAQADKLIHRMMTRELLQDLKNRFEVEMRNQLVALSQELGETGRLIPLQTRMYRTLYACSVTAMFGSGMPILPARDDLVVYTDNFNQLVQSNVLPFLPDTLWNKILPRGRRFVQARTALREAFAQWSQSTAASQACEGVQAILSLFKEKEVPPHIQGGFFNMLGFGLNANTAEVCGWLISYIVQSPKLYAAIVAECTSLPDGSVAELDLRTHCPLLHSAIQETIRCRSQLFAGRAVTKAFKLPGVDRTFEAGTVLRAMSRVAMYEESVWGANAALFDGARFSRQPDLVPQQLAFGGGATACPGRQYSVLELLIHMALLLRHFDVSDFDIRAKLSHTAGDYDLSALTSPGLVSEVVDLDGTIVKFRLARHETKGVEDVSGVLRPLEEPVVVMRPREGYKLDH